MWALEIKHMFSGKAVNIFQPLTNLSSHHNPVILNLDYLCY